MRIKIYKKIKSDKGILVIPVFKENSKKLPSLYPEPIREFINKIIKNNEFQAKKSEAILHYLYIKNLPPKVLIAGFGSLKKYKGRKAKEIGGKIGKAAKAAKAEELTIIMANRLQDFTKELVEGILMAQYEADKFKTKHKGKEYILKKLNIVAKKPHNSLKKAVEKAQLISSGVEYVKDLVNTPSNIVDSEYLALKAKIIARENKYKIVILGEKELYKMGWGALLAVNQGSVKGAKCIALEYDGGKRGEKPIVIIGKGLTFDSGGYNLKPIKFIEYMHQDMAGGAIILGLFKILKKLGIKKNIVGIVPIAENLIGSKAYRPSDIIKSFSGLTIEITNTDAEGRLILADAITYGIKFNPEAIITIATLTGAVIIALGDRYAGLLGNDLKLRAQLQKAGRQTDDLAWPLPIHRDHKLKVKSTVADLRNMDIGTERHAGASKAAAFLQNFIGKNKWCHIDIGGTAYTEDPKEYQTKGATAHGLQMLIRFLEQ